jgi:hypothetical protein
VRERAFGQRPADRRVPVQRIRRVARVRHARPVMLRRAVAR